jgi:hypothetical protein
MAHSHDRNLVQSLGIETDHKSPEHDLAVLYLQANAQALAKKVLPLPRKTTSVAPLQSKDAERILAPHKLCEFCVIKTDEEWAMPCPKPKIARQNIISIDEVTDVRCYDTELEHQVTKGEGKFQTLIGFLDLVICAQFTGTKTYQPCDYTFERRCAPLVPEGMNLSLVAVDAHDFKGAFLGEIRRAKKFFYGTVIAQAHRIDIEKDTVVFAFKSQHRSLLVQIRQNSTWLTSIATQLAGRQMGITSLIDETVVNIARAKPSLVPSDWKGQTHSGVVTIHYDGKQTIQEMDYREIAVEVKTRPISLGDALRQISLYREYHHANVWVFATTVPLDTAYRDALEHENIRTLLISEEYKNVKQSRAEMETL